MSAGGIRATLWAVLITSLLILMITLAYAQSVPCWSVPNGAAITMQCANGYFHTTMPDGTVVDGNGMTDPSATNPGSTIPLDDRGNIINRGAVQGPPPNQQNAAPGQWYYYGGRPPE